MDDTDRPPHNGPREGIDLSWMDDSLKQLLRDPGETEPRPTQLDLGL